MRKLLLLFFISAKLVAQHVPVWESNSYRYEKSGYGFDFLNIYSSFQSQDGSLVCSDYSGAYFKISNTSGVFAFDKEKLKTAPLLAYFEKNNGLAYYCMFNQILVIQKSKVIRECRLNTSGEASSDFTMYKERIYFVTLFSNKHQYLRFFDGVKVRTVCRLPDLRNGKESHLFVSDKPYIVSYADAVVEISDIERNLRRCKNYVFDERVQSILSFKNPDNFLCVNYDANRLFEVRDGKVQKVKMAARRKLFPYRTKGYLVANEGVTKIGLETPPTQKELFKTGVAENITTICRNDQTDSYYCGTGNHLFRLFPYVRKYPRLFNKTNSSSVFSLQQDSKGRIWTASYQGALSIIDGGKIIESQVKNLQFMNGGTTYKDKVILMAERYQGLLLFDDISRFRAIADSVTGFCSFISNDHRLYVGTSGQGLWSTELRNLNQSKPVWQKIGRAEGMDLFNILTICEDRFGNIWTGRSSQGIAVYNPRTKKVKTWLTEKKQISFGSNTTCLDNRKTMWFGTGEGELYFYRGEGPDDLDASNFVRIKHPLLQKGNPISFLRQWGDYLILGAGDKILLFNLRHWYKDKSILVRYLNPLQAAFSSLTEQNTVLTDRRDKSIWFATSDMVYQWDIKKWLTLPCFWVNPIISVRAGRDSWHCKPNHNTYLDATQNSLSINIKYQSGDNMPRFVNGVLAKKGEKPLFGHPNLQTEFQFTNLSAGDYIFHVRVCQQDGQVTTFRYPITINPFLWQRWWFWAVLSLLPVGFFLYFFRKKQQLSAQQKRLSQLTLSSLSNQFRPHFMLNALNSIGSQMQELPHAEKVISRLGESVDILYDFTRNGAFTHPFEKEWKLVLNIIEIQKLLFMPELQIVTNNIEIIPSNYPIPVGLLQIPVENALLHGLRNKTDGNCIIDISFWQTQDHYQVQIADNGVGREKARQINNFKRNGRGLPTIMEMIEIINQNDPNAIDFAIIDKEEAGGTIVQIKLKKHITYDKINP